MIGVSLQHKHVRGGSLVFYPNSVPPLINHWTPAFPIFYCALAIPVGIWLDSHWANPPRYLSRLKLSALLLGLAALAWFNISYYFGSYYANPDTLESDSYKTAQGYYEMQVAESRYVASMVRDNYTVLIVGKEPAPYDAELTRYLLGYNAQVQRIPNPEIGTPTPGTPDTGRAFIFFPGNEQYQPFIRVRYPGGTDSDVANPAGKSLFHTYILLPNAVANPNLYQR